MRPSPGVTVLQYFLMSLEQALSSFATLAVNFSRIVFPRSACAETEPTDKMASNGTSPSLARNFTVTFIERPLMTCSGPGGFSKSPYVRETEADGCFRVSSLCQ